MTLGELVDKKGLCGRVMVTHGADGFTFRGTITNVSKEGIIIHFTLANRARQFSRGSGPWKNLPNDTFFLGKSTPVETGDDGTVSFVLPKDGGRGYIYPKGGK